MEAYDDQQILNGAWGECWVDSDYMAEVTGVTAEVTFDKSETRQCRRLWKGYKVTGYDGKGTLKMNKVTSYWTKRISEDMKKGKTTVFTIIAKLDDPDAMGAERIKLSGCTLDKLTLADWENAKLGEESIGFTFTGFETLDLIG